MKKTIYIAKGESYEYDKLTCENIVVNGFLKVTDGITAKKISGTGVIHAGEIKADTLAAHDITAGYIIVDQLAAKRVSAVDIHAAQNIAVSTYLEAGSVKTQKALIADADVEDMQADEIVRISPKKHSLFGVLLLSTVKSICVELLYALRNLIDNLSGFAEDAEFEKVSDEPEISETDDSTETAADEEFQRFMKMYNIFYKSKAADASELSESETTAPSEHQDAA